MFERPTRNQTTRKEKTKQKKQRSTRHQHQQLILEKCLWESFISERKLLLLFVVVVAAALATQLGQSGFVVAHFCLMQTQTPTLPQRQSITPTHPLTFSLSYTYMHTRTVALLVLFFFFFFSQSTIENKPGVIGSRPT